MRRTPKLVFKVNGKVVHQATYPYRSEDVPRRGDSVRLPRERTIRMVQRVIYVYGVRGLLRIEILLTTGTRRHR